MVKCSAFLCALRGYFYLFYLFYLLYIKYNFMCSSKCERKRTFSCQKVQDRNRETNQHTWVVTVEHCILNQVMAAHQEDLEVPVSERSLSHNSLIRLAFTLYLWKRNHYLRSTSASERAVFV